MTDRLSSEQVRNHWIFYEGENSHAADQFDEWLNLERYQAYERGAWDQAENMARKMWDDGPQIDNPYIKER